MSPFQQNLDSFRDQEYREAYADDYLNTFIATQIQVLREQRRLSQEQFAELIGTKQPGVSRLENVNHSSWRTETLKRVAHALGLWLKVSFETYGDLIFETEAFSRKSLQRPEFKDDPVFASGQKHDSTATGSGHNDYLPQPSVGDADLKATPQAEDHGNPKAVATEDSAGQKALAA